MKFHKWSLRTIKYKGKLYKPILDIEITRDEIENLSEDEYIGLLWTEVKK